MRMLNFRSSQQRDCEKICGSSIVDGISCKMNPIEQTELQ